MTNCGLPYPVYRLPRTIYPSRQYPSSPPPSSKSTSVCARVSAPELPSPLFSTWPNHCNRCCLFLYLISVILRLPLYAFLILSLQGIPDFSCSFFKTFIAKNSTSLSSFYPPFLKAVVGIFICRHSSEPHHPRFWIPQLFWMTGSQGGPSPSAPHHSTRRPARFLTACLYWLHC